MNPLPPNVDELVSAYLDGEAAPDEIATVESNPELMQRVEALRSLSDSIDAPLEPPADLKEAHLGAALGLFDELVSAGGFSAAAANTADQRHTADPDDLGNPGDAGDLGDPGDLGDAGNPGDLHETRSASTPAEDGVVSFEAARERSRLRREQHGTARAQRPRRFNTGVIAAAAAALLLVVGLAALQFGRGSSGDDVATAEFDAAASSDSADDSTAESEAAVDQAMDDGGDDAAADDLASSDRSLGASQAPAAEPAPAESGAAADDAADGDALSADAGADEAVEEEAMDAEEGSAFLADDAAENEVGGDDAAEDDAEGDARDSADLDSDAPPIDPEAAEPSLPDGELFLGEYDSIEALTDQLSELTAEDLLRRADSLDELRYPGCQVAVAELAEAPEPTLVGEAMIDDLVVEVHALVDSATPRRDGQDQIEWFVLDIVDCATVATIP